MAQLLFKLGRWSFRWKWIVIVAWLLIFVAVWAAQTSLQRGFNDQFAIPGYRRTSQTYATPSKQRA